MKKYALSTLFLILITVDVFVWSFVVRDSGTKSGVFYFLDVGQGDSQLIQLPGSNGTTVDILIDTGPDESIVRRLDEILEPSDRYIDAVILTHPERDHIGGLSDVLLLYDVGFVATNGRRNSSSVYERFETIVREKNIPAVVLEAGDAIEYRDTRLRILSPDAEMVLHSELNEASLVVMLETPEISILYMGDAGFNVEEEIGEQFDLKVDVLKVGHHGSKNSSSQLFLDETKPTLSIIGVGENSYGHPTEATLSRLANINSAIYTTRERGTIKLTSENGLLRVYNTSP